MNRGSLVVGPGLGAGLLVGLGTTDLVVVIIQLSGNGAQVEVTKLGNFNRYLINTYSVTN